MAWCSSCAAVAQQFLGEAIPSAHIKEAWKASSQTPSNRARACVTEQWQGWALTHMLIASAEDMTFEVGIPC